MASESSQRKSPSFNGAPTFTPLGHYQGRPDIVLSRTATIIGSRSGSRLQLASSTVSKAHAILVNTNGGAYIHDLASRTGLFVNNEKVREVDLKDGDTVQIGKFKFRFNAGLPPERDSLEQAGPVEVFPPAEPASLFVAGEEMPIPFDDRAMLIGRRPTSDIPLLEESASTSHAVIYEFNGKRYLRDLGSRTGTFLNGQKIKDATELPVNSDIKVGETAMRYGLPQSAEVDELEHLVGTAPLGDALDMIGRSAEAAQAAEVPTADEPGSTQTAEADADALALESLMEPAAEQDAPADAIDFDEEAAAAIEPVDTQALPLEPESPKARREPKLVTPAEEADDEPSVARLEKDESPDHLVEMRRGWHAMEPDAAPPAAPEIAEGSAADVQVQPEPVIEPDDEKLEFAPAAEEADEETKPPTPVEPEEIEPVVVQPKRIELSMDDLVQTAERSPALEEPDTAVAPAMEAEEPQKDDRPSITHAEPAATSLDNDAADLLADIEPTPEELALDLPIPPEDLSDDSANLDLSLTSEPDLGTSADEDEAQVIDLTPPDDAAGPEVAEPETLHLEISDEAKEIVESPVVPEAEEELEAKPAKKQRARRPKRKKPEAVQEPNPAVQSAAVAPETEEDSIPMEVPVVEGPEDRAPATELPAEVLESTEPNPESAFSLADDIAPAAEVVQPADADEAEPVDLTDTTFGRAVESFTGESTGPLVEAADAIEEAPPADEPTAEAAGIAPADDVQLDEMPSAEDTAASEEVSDEMPLSLESMPDHGETPTIDEGAKEDFLPELSLDAEADLTQTDQLQLVSPADDDTAFALDLESGVQGEAEAAKAEEDALTGLALDSDHAVAEEETVVENQPVAGPTDATPAGDVDEPSEEADSEATDAEAEHAEEAPPPAETSKSSARPAPVGGWGPNQEHFLGGRPLNLGTMPPRPRRAVPFSAVPVAPPPDDEVGGNVAASAESAGASLLRPPGLVGDAGPGDISATIPPFTGKSAKRSQVTTGFDGLAMPPVRETDVFSSMAFPVTAHANPAVADVFGGRHGAARETVAPQRDTSHEIPPTDENWVEESAAARGEDGGRRARSISGRGNLPPEPPAAADLPTPPRRKRRWFGLRMLLVMMLLFMTLAAAAAYLFVPIPTIVEGQLRFNRFEALNHRDQLLRLDEQKRLLNSQNVAQLARDNLRNRFPQLSAGFLTDPRQLALLASSAAWGRSSDGSVDGALMLRVSDRVSGYEALRTPPGSDGGIAEPNRKRLYALVLALYQANGDQAERARALTQEIASLTEARADVEEQIASLQTRIKQQGGQGSTEAQASVARLQAEAETLEKAWIAAKSMLNDLKAEVERLRASIPADPHPAGTAQQAVVADDQIAEMEADLKKLNTQIAFTRQQRQGKVEDAREALDQAMKAFEQQVASAEGATKNQPQLQDYVAAAQKLQKPARDLIEKLIQRQEEHNTQLNELKEQMIEKMEAIRADAWKKDPELREMNDQLAIAQRKYNVAVESGFTSEAEDLKAQIGLIEKTIQAKQTLVGDDQFYRDSIDALDKVIASNLRKIEEDRKETEAKLLDEQQSFAEAQPSIETLPEDQQAVATSLKSSLAGMNDARQAYYEALDAMNVTGDDTLQDLQAQAAAISTEIAERRKGLADESARVAAAKSEQERLDQLKTKETELASARDAEQKAQVAWSEADAEVRAAQAAVSSARQTNEQVALLAQQVDQLEQDLALKTRTIEMRQATLDKMVEPLAPTDEDVRITRGQDPRLVYSAGAMIAVVALFSVLIFFTSARHPAPEEHAVPEANLASPEANSGEFGIAPGEASADSDAGEVPAEPDRRRQDQSHVVA